MTYEVTTITQTMGDETFVGPQPGDGGAGGGLERKTAPPRLIALYGFTFVIPCTLISSAYLPYFLFQALLF